MTTERIAKELRKTGISVIGDIPWGTHFCHFYETKQDLLDTLAPYFKTGLESGEFCLWVVSQPLTVEDAKRALAQIVPDLDHHLARRNLAIYSHERWYLQEGRFDPRRVLQSWCEKLKEALARGYSGMRASANTAWIQREDWKDFRRYERELDTLIEDERIIILCTYPLTNSPAAQIFDVARIHHVAVARRHGSWELVETPELKQAKAEIKRLNEELEQRVIERTKDLARVNEQLRKENIERQRVEERLREYEKAVEGLEEMITVVDRNYRYLLANRAFLNYRGLAKEQVVGRLIPEVLDREVFENITREKLDECFQGHVVRYELRYRYPHLGERDLFISYFPIEGPAGVDRVACVLMDITERKRAEENARHSRDQLRALSARLESLREQERIRIAREIHDELGQKVTALKMDLLRVERKLGELESSPAVNALLDTVVGATELASGIITSVQKIATELRPGALDKLGLGPALQYEARQFQERTGIPCKVRLPEREPTFSSELSTALFRIFQECLTNVARHANASEVEAELRIDSGCVVLSVHDNGRGITQTAITSPGALGLLGMKERAALLAGEISFHSGPAQGTTVTARLPHPGLPSQSKDPA